MTRTDHRRLTAHAVLFQLLRLIVMLFCLLILLSRKEGALASTSDLQQACLSCARQGTLLGNLGRHKQQVPQDLFMPLLSIGKLSQPIPVLR